MREQSSESTEYVECRVQVTDPVTGQFESVSDDVVEMAFVTVGATPVSADWKAAVWLSTSPGMERAAILVGPHGGLVLPVASYGWWVRITDNPEQPAVFVDKFRIT
jgi:hypothetical protein